VSCGASVEAVRLLAGHSDLAITLRYVHALGNDLKAAIAKLSYAFGRIRPTSRVRMTVASAPSLTGRRGRATSLRDGGEKGVCVGDEVALVSAQ
jgi:hypothetical protein